MGVRIRTVLLGALLLAVFFPDLAHANCNTDPSTFPPVISYSASSYCLLCGVGTITLTVTNPDPVQQITNVNANVDLTGSGLEYVTGSTRIDGAAAPDPSFTSIDGKLTWTFASVAPSTSHVITFQVQATTAGASTAEDLVSATRQISPSVSFDFLQCNGTPWPTTTQTIGPETVPLQEPIPAITKLGRNVDAGQTGYTATVYGNISDDVIWRIGISNSGLAAMQDVIFDDLMPTSNMNITYACPDQASALAVANNNGTPPGGSSCIAASNSISAFQLYGFLPNPVVAAGGTSYVYLVGKVTSSCFNASNTASNLQWGCRLTGQPADGGITTTSTGFTPGPSSALMSTQVNTTTGLTVTRTITGIGGGALGTRGIVRIRIANNSGGTVKNIDLADTLPANYVVDPTYTPRLAMTYAYGTYPGADDILTWTNPAGGAGTIGVPPSNATDFLSNTKPTFTLTSSTQNPTGSTVYHNMLRNGDTATVTFRVVMVNSNYFDKAADLDIAPETFATSTDPAQVPASINTLNVSYYTFCPSAPGPGPFTQSFSDNVTPNPEDIDINFNAPLYIITDNPAYPVPITVNLTNNGGDTAANYFTYVSFGEEMTVESAPANCSLTSNPPPKPVWPLPTGGPPPIPSTATVYECSTTTGMGNIAAGQTRSLTFQVTKNTAATTDDLFLRADVIGEIHLSDGTPLVYPTPSDPIGSTVDNYTLDAIRSRALGFNLTKALPANCSEDNPPPVSNNHVIIGEECQFHIESGGWFGFQTPGYTLIAVQNVSVTDQMPTGQGFLQQLNSGTSQITTPTVTTPATLGYGNVTWAFNPSTSPITTKGEWFKADVATRLMNDAQNASAPPNQQAALSTNIALASFQAVFDTTTIDVTPTAGVPGYPAQAVRQVVNTVTEPNLQVTKEVCNETLHGTYPNCSNWTTLANDGDTDDTYIYRIRVHNQASSGGVERAPAYNVKVTDTLDPLMHVVPLGSDGLDNDDDGLIDGNDTNGEGTVNNTSSPPTITFSDANSIALQRIAPNGTVNLYYRVKIDNSAAPLQTLTNTVNVTYDSLLGAHGNEGAYGVPGGNTGDLDGARVYNATPASASVQIIPLLTQPKTVTATSNTPLSPTSPQPVSIGEEMRYQLTTQLPVAKLRNFIIRDNLPAGVRCSEAPAVNLNSGVYASAGFVPGGTITPTCTSTGTNDYVEWDFGDQQLTTSSTDRFSFPVSFIGRVENTAITNDGNVISNGGTSTNATASYVDQNGNTVTLQFGNADVQVREPKISLTKAFNVATADAGDKLTVTVTATNTGTATAYNLRVLDNLVGTKMTFLNSVSGTDPPNNIDTTTLGANEPIFSWNKTSPGYAIAPGGSVSFTYQVSVDISVEPNEVLTDTIQAAWQSLPGQSTALNSTGLIGPDGSVMGMRNGALPNAGDPVDDYETTASATVNIASTSLAKVHALDTYSPDNNVRIGDIVQYELHLTLPEGTTPGVTLTDVLPQGLEFEGTVSVNGDTTAPYQSAGPFTYGGTPGPIVSGNAATGPTTVTWNLGTIVNAGDNNPSNNDFIIVYRARVLNAVLPHVNNIPLTNTATFTWTPTAGGTPSQTATALSNVVQPNLSVTKSAAPAGGSTIINANELIAYTVNITNNGTAPAYDTVLRDVIPVGLRNGAATVTTNSITLVNAGTTLPNLAPSYNASTGVALWNFDTGTANAYTIPAGDTLRVVYTVQADPDLGPGLVMTNQAQVQVYYSFDNNAVPTLGGIKGVREIYGQTNTASVTLTSAAPNPLSKQNPAVPTATIGQTFNYRITVPATPMTVALHNVVILDDLSASAADLNFVKVTRVSGSQPWTPVNTGTNKNLVIQDSGSGIEIPAGEQIQMDITVQVANTAVNVAGLKFHNTASYLYDQIKGDNTTQKAGGGATTPDMTIVEPDVTLQKTGPATVLFGQPSTFTLNVQNTGTSKAWDLTVVDELPNPTPGGMCDTAPTNIIAGIYDAAGTTLLRSLTAGTDFTSSFAPAPTCTLTVITQTAAAAPDPGERLIIKYDAVPDNDNTQGEVLSNIAGVTQWFSLDTAGAGATGQTRTYTRAITDGTPGVLDWQDVWKTTVDVPTLAFTKTVVNVTTGQNPGSNASPGDTLHYHITVQNTSPVPLPNFTLTDEPDRLNTSGKAWFVPGTMSNIVVPAGADTSNTNINGGALGTGLLDVRNLHLDPVGGTNDTLTIDFDIKLASSIPNGTLVLNQAQIQIPNFTLLNSDDPNVTGTNDPTQTLIGSSPQLQVEKTVQDLTGSPTVHVSGDTMRYTITVKNVGNEDLTNSILSDQIPANTTYVANSTTLNGTAVADPSPGISALQNGMPINSADNTTSGLLTANSSTTANNVATITFSVVINPGVINGTVISNQGFLNGTGADGTAISQQPTDDPSTPVANDPTNFVVGNLPLIDSQKTVAIAIDGGTPGIVDPGDTLKYTITVTNSGATTATNVVLTDAIPANTTYVAGTTTLNGLAVADVGTTSALVGGLPVSSSDLTPPLPTAGNGQITVGQVATVTFEVQVNAGVAGGTLISNQGVVTSNEQAPEPTDADGNQSNGDQPTVVVVGSGQQLAITKSVAVVGGGTALAGGQLQYTVQVTNVGSVPANNVSVTDAVPANTTYVANSTTLNGLAVADVGGTSPLVGGMPVSSSDLTPPLPTAGNGTLSPGGTATVQYRVQINNSVPIGTTITNTAQVDWNAGTQNASASVSIDVGGTPGVANLNGRVWHDSNFNNVFDSGERPLQNWSVDLYRNGTLLDTVTTDANGNYAINGLAPNNTTTVKYDLRFRAPGASATTGSLGQTDSPFTDGPQHISNIVVGSGANVQNLNLPIDPDGVIYDSISRLPIAGATVTMLQAGSNTVLSTSCFVDPAQQNQVTLADGWYKFDLQFGDPTCPAPGDYLLQVTPPASGYVAGPSTIIPPTTSASTATYPVPSCPPNGILTSTGYCEAQSSDTAPAQSVPAGSTGTDYYLHLTYDSSAIPRSSQMFNNHIPLDPNITGSGVSITKTTPLKYVNRGSLVPYTITVNDNLTGALTNNNIVDTIPPGFKYVVGSATVDGVTTAPTINGRQLTWSGLTLTPGTPTVVKLVLIIGSGVGDGNYVNQAQVNNATLGSTVSGIATATVRVVPDPTFDCTDVIGKVFDDRNNNGYPDAGEPGIAGARVTTVHGLLITTDSHGRYHVTCADVPNADRGSNLILKLDPRSLPSGYRITTENPRVVRATRGKMVKVNFGASIHHVVRLSVSDAAFVPVRTALRPEWKASLDTVLEQLKKQTSVLRIVYLGDTETASLARARIRAISAIIKKRWKAAGAPYTLGIETELYWRRGKPGGAP